ncbi:hypothetical protein ACJJI3_02385 [Microbulbifer sp. ZKSA004]|uniref:hypothetical protein n=1 Tax=Microbulbifer sp. ZKSA004 TaxID=3243389 RepID=UPI0040391019
MYKLGELNEEGCAVNFRIVRSENHSDSENIHIQANKGVALYVNMVSKTTCSVTRAMSLESYKYYEACVLPFQHSCGVCINNITDGKKGEKIEIKYFRDGYVREYKLSVTKKNVVRIVQQAGLGPPSYSFIATF